MERTGRRGRGECEESQRRGFFGGSSTVRYGLIVVLLFMIFINFYNSMYEGKYLRGPIDDIFRRKSSKLTIIYPTGGGAADAPLEDYVRKVADRLGEKLAVKVPVQSDRKAGRWMMKKKSLILYGPVEENSVIRRLSDGLPFRFEDGKLGRGDGTWIGRKDWRLVFIVPNPKNRAQYVLVYTAATPERLVGINFRGSPNFVPHDTTDYVLAAGDSILAAGYFNKDSSGTWTLPPGALASVGR